MIATATEETIDRPGVYILDEATYLADPVAGGSLTATGARKLLDCPARYRWWRTHRDPPKTEFDLGKSAHKLVLGAGPGLVVVDAKDWRTDKAKQAKAAAYADGKVPLLPHQHATVQAMAAALRAHPTASALFDPQHGDPERTLVWKTPDNLAAEYPARPWWRSQLDWLPHPTDGRMLAVDYKTCESADPDSIDRAIASFGYHIKAAVYLTGLHALRLAGADARFLLVFQERDAPYLVTVAEVGQAALKIGAYLMRRAEAIWAECTATGRWPGYAGDEVVYAGLPPYVERTYLEEMSNV